MLRIEELELVVLGAGRSIGGTSTYLWIGFGKTYVWPRTSSAMKARQRTRLRILLSIFPGSLKVLNQGMEKNLAKYYGEGSSNLGSEGVQAISSHLSIRNPPNRTRRAIRNQVPSKARHERWLAR